MAVAVQTVRFSLCFHTLTLMQKNILILSLKNLGLDPDISPDEQEEKARLIAQVLELQNTLDGNY